MKRIPEANLRLLMLMVSLVVIVGAGFLVRQNASNDTVEAFRWVDHTHQVRSALFELRATVSTMHTAAFAARLKGDAIQSSQNYIDARDRIPALLGRLRELTSDSPEQQERIGLMRGRIEQRVALFDGDEQRGINPDNSEMTAEIARLPINEIADAILSREEGLVKRRQDAADAQVRTGAWVTAVTAFLQILLLGAVIWASERQLQRRVFAESETRTAIGRARLIVETVREPIAVITGELRVLQANQAFADFYQLERPILGSLVDVPAWRDPGLRQRLKDVVTMRRELWDYETEQSTAADTVRHVVVNARPMILQDTTEQTALLTVSDVTMRKRSEEQVLELNRQLSGKVAQVTEVNRELEAFSYSVSHDLRAPLRHIAGFSDKLRTQLVKDGDDKMRHYCEVISESARRMSTLIEDLLSYSRLGRNALRLQAVDMQSLVDEVRSTLMSSVENRAIRWRVAPLPVAVADASMLRLVWQNLIDNAIKYTAGR
ncbi:MAG: histidine kinase dimerization/phospho-acceptor domain-containing protein, partial [Dokdonella sp.]|uniref:sensor histidine kinase n=1 Tax=Dokdonella sp. TaxID=2291710 RepID=UPI0032665320